MKLFKYKKIWYIAANAVLIVLLILYVAFFTVETRKTSSEKELAQFVSSADIVQQEATRYLDSVCKINRDWTSLVNKRKWTIAEVAENIGDLNSDQSVMVQVVRADNLTGISSAASETEPENYSVDYSNYASLKFDLERFSDYAKPDNVYVTGSFTNCINAKQSIGFVSLINTYAEDGGLVKAFLMRVEPLETISRNWVFKTDYAEAQISMITTNGDYVLRAPMMKNENFYEFLRSYNDDITYPKSRAIRNKIISSEKAGSIIYKNSQGADTIYAYSTGGYNSWIIIAALEKSKIKTEKIQWSLLFVTSLVFIMLIALNLFYFLTLNRQLHKSLDELKEANSAKTRFLSSMSHDIRTPMNAIVGLTTIAANNITDTSYVRDCLRKIKMAGDLLLTLINDILDISQVESGKFVLRPAAFSLPDAVENLINIIYPQALEKNLHFTLNAYDITEEYLYADKLRLNQIWINILSNAVKYTMEGGHIDASFREEHISGNEKCVRLIFTVRDTGIGMSDEYQKTIFEPFTRENDSRIDTIQGSGFGMTVTKNMVDLMNGTIEVQSKQGEGSVFTVTIDLEYSKPKTEPKTFPNTETLLVCSEEGVGRTRKIWDSLEIKPEFCDAANAEAVFEKSIRDGKPYKVVIIGRNMSDGECLEISRKLRTYAPSETTKIIVAAYDFSDLEQCAAAAGIDAFVHKPVFASSVSAAISSVVCTEDYETDKIDGVNSEFSHIRLLVAEDNDLNWEIFETLLGFINVKADRTVNGRECVNALKAAKEDKYTAVFMDIQMPMLNGYDAVREIRMLENRRKANIPIIAMTADAFASDVERCLAAGMNGHIAKPIDMNILIEELKKLSRHTKEEHEV